MERTGLMLKVEEKIGEDVKDYLRREYVVNQRTSPEIAEEIGIGSSSVIYWLKGFELPIRTKSEAQALAKTPGRFKSPELQRVEQSLGESIEVFLRREYLENKRPATIIAEECGVHSATLYTWMKNYKIPIRDKSEAQSLAKLSEGVRKPSKSQ